MFPFKATAIQREVGLEYAVLRCWGTSFERYAQDIWNISGGKTHILGDTVNHVLRARRVMASG